MRFLLALMLSWSMAMAEPAVTGVVKDASGAVVPSATVILRSANGSEQRTQTDLLGRFTFPNNPEAQVTLIVRAGGFGESSQTLTKMQDVEVVLQQEKLMETVYVTPNRSQEILGDTPVSLSVVEDTQIRRSPAVVADDVLRQVPTFSLFRRASSLSAHPTSQGVSLRNIGPSGVSRTLVLIDNVPFNDPFGGWVYWTRVPLEDVDRIEVVNGSSSSLYGNYAMGGVINIVSNKAKRRTFELKPQFGNLDSRKLDFFASDVWGKLGIAVSGSGFDSNGFPNVKENERGPIDTKTAVEFANFNVKADYTFNNSVNAFFRGGYFKEDRENGKVATTDGTPPGTPNGTPEQNDTRWKSAAGGVRWVLPDQSDLQVTVFSDFEDFHSNFLAVPNIVTRQTARLTLDQKVPTTNVGGMAQWSRAFGSKNYVNLGTDWRWTDGDSNEDSYDTVTGTTIVLKRVAGGTQRSLGVYVQDVYTPLPQMTVTVSARVDNWKNYDGHNLETTVATGQPAPGNKPTLPDRDDTVGSPRFAALYRLTSRVNVWGDMSWGFRAPTLNELYRQFRQGTNLVQANENLGPERLVGGEGGVSAELAHGLIVRGTMFDNRVKDPVSNVTLTTTPALTTQQRQNLGRTRIWGFQTDVDYKLGDTWQFSGAYLYNQAKVTENDKNPALVGLYLPQVPSHRGSLQVAYMNPRLVDLALGMQFIGRQFDDDLNVRTVGGSTEPGLPKFAVVDIMSSRRITGNFEAFFGVQNLFDKEYYVGTNPTLIGTPRLVTGGVRVGWSGK